MTCQGAISLQPPQLTRQYVVKEASRALRAASSSRLNSISALGGGSSRTTRCTSFPLEHFVFGIRSLRDAPRCAKVSTLTKSYSRNRGITHLARASEVCTTPDCCGSLQPMCRTRAGANRFPSTVLIGRTDGPGVSPSPVGAGANPIPQRNKGASSPPSLHQQLYRLPPPMLCQLSERSGQIRAVNGGAFILRRRPQVVTHRDLVSLAKVHPDHVAHLSFLMSTPAPEASAT